MVRSIFRGSLREILESALEKPAFGLQPRQTERASIRRARLLAQAEPPAGDATLLRSIDRIETDLNEVRSELERMREKVKPENQVK